MSPQLSLLLIEDEVDFLEILSRRFHRRGFEVVCASAIDDALATVGNRKIDVILMDRTLRGLDCLEALPRLRLGHPDLKVLILSGRSDAGSIAEAMSAGAHGYLKKPCSLAEIEQAITQACATAAPIAGENAPQAGEFCGAAN